MSRAAELTASQRDTLGCLAAGRPLLRAWHGGQARRGYSWDRPGGPTIPDAAAEPLIRARMAAAIGRIAAPEGVDWVTYAITRHGRAALAALRRADRERRTS